MLVLCGNGTVSFRNLNSAPFRAELYNLSRCRPETEIACPGGCVNIYHGEGKDARRLEPLAFMYGLITSQQLCYRVSPG